MFCMYNLSETCATVCIWWSDLCEQWMIWLAIQTECEQWMIWLAIQTVWTMNVLIGYSNSVNNEWSDWLFKQCEQWMFWLAIQIECEQCSDWLFK